jgi:histidine triad (HIT) family protein
MPEETLFQKIADKKVPADIVYEDDQCLAFHDIDPKAPVHVLVVPREPIPSIDDVREDHEPLVGHLVCVARRIASEMGLSSGYRLVFNCGPEAGQSVDHIHLHLLGGRRMTWPPG